MAGSAPPKRPLVVATRNRGKLAEFASLLAGLPVEVHVLGDVAPGDPPVIEDGTTFAENAIKKARAAARATGMLALGDDSGLEVDALDGRPGVRSARFAGEDADDAANNAALLAALRGCGRPPPFSARFRCVLALVDPRSPASDPTVVEGRCEGTIGSSPRGSNGFGYDPIFILGGADKTMAELGPDEKNRISHRGRAFAALRAHFPNKST
jgi:XTP/dITP diphosphohydrolase